MEKSDFIKRIEDLSERSERNSELTCTAFLTPAEQYELAEWAAKNKDAAPYLSGGRDDAERKIAFFLPWYIQAEELEINKYITAIKIQSFFGEPGHRDYLGAILGLGINRDRIGDIIVIGSAAYVLCVPSVAKALLTQLEKVGRCGVKLSEIEIKSIPPVEKKTRKLNFTVKSLRLDAVTGDVFGISRTKAAEYIRYGAVSLNYSVCQQTDAEIKEGDVISLRGKGKACITSVGGRSKKDRLFIEAEILL